MEVYQDLYYQLFAAVADAVESLEANEPLAARRALVAAMRAGEERVISAGE
ncbi:MAG: hypothetical protein K6G54_00970 [Oscillospiraceae bacterium]|nr:hypothetical protein [Oscillospiraceae bacterium]